MFVRRLRTSFTIHHDFFPRMKGRGFQRNLVLFGGPFPETDTRQTFIDPSFHIWLHGHPIHELGKQRVGDREVPVYSENSSMQLQEAPLFPSQVTGSIPVRNDRDPFFLPEAGSGSTSCSTTPSGAVLRSCGGFQVFWKQGASSLSSLWAAAH